MKVKISLTLSRHLLKEIDSAAGPNESISAFIERAVRVYLADLGRQKMHARDVQLINASANELNAEAADVLGYQTPTPG